MEEFLELLRNVVPNLLQGTVITLQLAGVSLVKGDALPTEREFEQYLKGAGFSSRQSKAIISGGFRSLTQDENPEGFNLAEELRRIAKMMRP